MALTVTVTKGDVQQVYAGMSRVSLTMTLEDDGPGPGLTRTYSETYKAGKAIADLVVLWRQQMQTDIDKYKAERAIYDNPLFATAAQAVATGLEV